MTDSPIAQLVRAVSYTHLYSPGGILNAFAWPLTVYRKQRVFIVYCVDYQGIYFHTFKRSVSLYIRMLFHRSLHPAIRHPPQTVRTPTVSYTHLDVYKRQCRSSWECPFPGQATCFWHSLRRCLRQARFMPICAMMPCSLPEDSANLQAVKTGHRWSSLPNVRMISSR